MNPPPLCVALIASEMTTSIYKGLGVFSEFRNVVDVLDYSCRCVIGVVDASRLDFSLIVVVDDDDVSVAMVDSLVATLVLIAS
jgi:hypothetical protein